MTALYKTVKKELFKIFGLALAIAVIPIIVLSIQYRQELRKKAADLPDDTSFHLTYTEILLGIGGRTYVYVFLLNPNGIPIDGVDVILRFNQDILQLRSFTTNTETNFKAFLPLVDEGGSFDADRVISQANSLGRLEFGAITFDFATDDFTSPVGDNDVLIAELEFEGISEGSSLVDFDFDPDREDTRYETVDCNVATHSDGDVFDILGSTDSVTITVSVVGPSPTPTGTITPSPTPSISPTPTPTEHCLPLGDIDCSGKVNSLDYSYLIANYYTSDPAADLDDSGKVNALDVSVLLFNFGKESGSLTPTPTLAPCVEEGEWGDRTDNPDLKCCKGLDERPSYDLGRCIAIPDLTFNCIKCDDGNCGPGENRCNCPEDCGSPTPLITPTPLPTPTP